eukprot:SAG22_NODE_2784_length_2212_cov_2.925225_3_plen_149_part_00
MSPLPVWFIPHTKATNTRCIDAGYGPRYTYFEGTVPKDKLPKPSEVSCKALPFCCASTAFLSKTALLLAVLRRSSSGPRPARRPTGSRSGCTGPSSTRRCVHEQKILLLPEGSPQLSASHHLPPNCTKDLGLLDCRLSTPPPGAAGSL